MSTNDPQQTYWESPRKPAFDQLLVGSWSAHSALVAVRRWEDIHSIPSPSVYVSTAITSGGYRRDASLDLPEVIKRNNRSAGLLMGVLCETSSSIVAPDGVMVPTELGKVAGWRDTHYLQFYFAYAAGLSEDASARFDAALADPVFARIRDRADDRTKENDERKPEYFAFTEIALSQLAQVTSRHGATAYAPFGVLAHLIDVGYSLGCQAETRFAVARGLDIVSPSVLLERDALGEELYDDLTALDKLGSTVGVRRHTVELVPQRLSSLEM